MMDLTPALNLLPSPHWAAAVALLKLVLIFGGLTAANLLMMGWHVRRKLRAAQPGRGP